MDPRSARREEKLTASNGAVKTFEVVAEEWHAFKSPRMTAARKGDATQSRMCLDKDLIPSLGKLPISDIRRSDVLPTIRRVEARGALNVARKCGSWLNEIFRFAIASGYIEHNPASDLDIVAVKEPP